MRQQPRRKLFVENLEDRDLCAMFAVATSGSDTTGTGSVQAPYRSIQKAVNVANSGDTILVAGGTYNYEPAQDTFQIQQLATKQVVTIFNEVINIFGGYSVADGFKSSNPQANPVIVDGQNQVRGLLFVALNAVPTGGTIQGITFRNGLGTPLATGTNADKVFAFGGGAFVNMGGSQNDTTPITFRNVLFENNKAIGLAGVANDPTQNFGGGGAGGGLDVRFSKTVTLENVIFRNNLAQGGPGIERGGIATGGALHVDQSIVTATNVTFEGNQALAGSASVPNAVGIPNNPNNAFTADATGGAIAVQAVAGQSNASFTANGITVINNTALGGNADKNTGSGFGGGFFSENSTVNLTNGIFQGNVAQGGIGDAGSTGGGGIFTDRGNTTIDRVKIINNSAIAGNVNPQFTAGALSAAGGGGIRTTTSTTQPNRTTIIRNSVIANNILRAGSSAPAGAPGAGAAVWLQGVNATIENSTIANNSFDPKLSFGEAIILLNDGAVTQTSLNLSNSTITGHDLPGSEITLFRGTSVNFNRNLITNVSVNGVTTAEPIGGGPVQSLGVVTGASSNLNGANPLYTSPNSPNFDYSIQRGSPLIDGSSGSSVNVDISNQPRTGTADIGAFEFGTTNASQTGSTATGANVTTGPVGFDGKNQPPTITAIANPAAVTVGTILSKVNFTIADPDTPIGNLQLIVNSTNPALVPATNVVFSGSGGSKIAEINALAGVTGSSTITITVNDGLGGAASSTFTVTVNPVVGPNPGTPVLVGFPQFAAGQDSGGSQATLFNPDGSVRFTTTPFPNFTGGVRTSAADFTGDGIADLVVGTGPGRSTRVRVLDGATQAELFAVDPFEASFTGGVYLATGDFTGDGTPDLAVTPDQGGGPRVDLFNGKGFGSVNAFFGIDDPNFRGGARGAFSDLNGDGRADLVVVAGFGGGPRVAAFDATTLGTQAPVKLFGDFFAFEQGLRNGIFVAAGDVNGDGFADLVAGGGPGGGPRVSIFDGKSLLNNQQTRFADFFGGDANSRGGIRVSVKNLDNDTFADVVVGSGSDAGSRVTSYLGTDLRSGLVRPIIGLDAFAGFNGGIFVG